MAVDPTQTEPARDVGNKAATWPNKIVTHAKVQSEIVVLNPLENRFGEGADVKLIVTAQPTITLYHAPADARRNKFCADLIIARGIDDAEQISGLERQLKPVRIEFGHDRRGGRLCDPCERLRASEKKNTNN